jgi:predicted N-acetyltransferase YhbS
MQVRVATDADSEAVDRVIRAAFGPREGPEVADLVTGLLDDPSAAPLLSLLAEQDGQVVGYVLFTRARVTDFEDAISAVILAPLAVVPETQRLGVGGRLVEEGLRRLAESGVELVFVLGHPTYYPRQGFAPAGALGFEPTYPIPEKNAGAWMAQELRPGVIGTVNGRVLCADTLDRPEHWRE